MPTCLTPASRRFVPRCSAVAAAVLCATAARAAVTVTGVVDNSTGSPLGPGDVMLPNTVVWAGTSGGPGSLTVDGGSFAQLSSLHFGVGGTGNGKGLIAGAGTRVELVGDGARLQIGNWGTGELTVSGGASLDTSGNQAPCLVQFHYCDSFVGSVAGDTGRLTLTGAGTTARVGQNLFVGVPALYTVPVNGYQSGVAGGTTSAVLEVLAGASLVTDRAQVGTRQWSSGNTGYERSVSNVTLAGAGSRWVAVGGQQWDGVTGETIMSAAGILTANDRYAVANIEVRDGAEMRIEGVDGLNNYINLTNGGGRTDMLVTGSGSAVTFTGDAGVLQVGRSLGSAAMSVLDGAQVSGVWYGSVGRDGSFGELAIDGAGTRFVADGTSSAAANGTAQVAVLDIGRNSAGSVAVSNGARLEVLATQARENGPQLNLGRGAASSGMLSIVGAGSTVLLRADSAGTGAGEARNPFVRIGRDGSGTLNISGGGKLLLEGHAVSTVADTRRTSLFIGGSGDTTVGGKGVATVTGLGSEIRVAGSDAYIGVGHGPLASGNLVVSDQARAAATILGVGNFGGTGIVALDKAQVELAGQFSGAGEYGAALVVGAGNGAVGVLNASNGTYVRIANSGSNGGGITIGGSSTLAGGDGSMTLSASTVEVVMVPGTSAVSVGRSGSGMLRMKDGSTLAMADSALFIGRETGSDGTLIATGGSTITAGWVGVGRDRVGGTHVDGGTATMVLNGATLNAHDVVIGTNGFLGGTAGAINASGSIVNYGIFSPGSSPGLFSVNGNFVAGGGSRLILEIESDGVGGFKTDEVHFGAGRAIGLAAMRIEFRFLGTTDPNAFQASGSFDIDSFLRQADASGVFTGLADSEYDGVTFAARADAYTFHDFSFSAAGGAIFSATPVPEPAAWLLMAAGLAAVGLHRRRVR